MAEHAPRGRRGAYTAWIQTTATLGLLMSLLVILGVRTVLGEAAFADWGWRVPFLLSVVLLGISVWIRLSLDESPAFQRMKSTGRTSPAPVSESFGAWKNLRVVLIALVGLTAGQAVVWYTGQFYALFFLTQQLRVDATAAQLMVAAALVIGVPFFLFFGALSDCVGRKPIIMLGCVLAAASYFPAFKALAWAANPAWAEAQARSSVIVEADPAGCTFLFNPGVSTRLSSPCDLARQVLTAQSVSYQPAPARQPGLTVVRIGASAIESPSLQGLPAAEARRRTAAFRQAITDALAAHGYPDSADPQRIDVPRVILILSYLMVLVAMVYGPLAAMLVEMFPTRIRYTSLSLPYHVGNGWFGGLLAPAAFAIVAQTGNVFSGLWYPVVVAAATALAGMLLLQETRDVDICARD